jgi:hypothetical protein
MITPAAYDITIQQNATFSQAFQLKDGSGAALNMTGYSVAAQLWTANKSNKLADFVHTWTAQATGQFKLSLSASVTAMAGAGGYWDMLVTNPDGTKDYWLRGAVVLDMGFTE